VNLAERLIYKETLKKKGKQEATEQSRLFLLQILEVRTRAI
jgi:uncharacterized protein YhhL (DUF1145 family)